VRDSCDPGNGDQARLGSVSPLRRCAFNPPGRVILASVGRLAAAISVVAALTAATAFWLIDTPAARTTSRDATQSQVQDAERSRLSDSPPDAAKPSKRSAAWHLVVELCDDSGARLPGTVYLTNHAGDLLEVQQVDEGELAEFDTHGCVAVRAVSTGYAPCVTSDIEEQAIETRRLQLTLSYGLTITCRFDEEDWDLFFQARAFAVPVDAPWNAARGESWKERRWDDQNWLAFRAQPGSHRVLEIDGLVPGLYRLDAKWRDGEYECVNPPVVAAGTEGVILTVRHNAQVCVRFRNAETQLPIKSRVDWSVMYDGASSPLRSGSGNSDCCSFWLRPYSEATLTVEAECTHPREALRLRAGAPGESTEVSCDLDPDDGAWAAVDLLALDEEGNVIPGLDVFSDGPSATTDDRGMCHVRLAAGSHEIALMPDLVGVFGRCVFWCPFTLTVELGRGETKAVTARVARGGIIFVRGRFGGDSPWLVHDAVRIDDAFFPDIAWPPKGGPESLFAAVVRPGTYRVEARGLASAEVHVSVGDSLDLSLVANGRQR